MPLISSRFRNIPALENCLVNDQDHLIPGSSGWHITLVQEALLDLGEDLSVYGADGVYGTETEEAVKHYKTMRNIVSPTGVIDGIVGKRTIAALDAEIDQLDSIGVFLPVVIVKVIDTIDLPVAFGGTIDLIELASAVGVSEFDPVLVALSQLLPGFAMTRVFHAFDSDFQGVVDEAKAADPSYAAPIFENFFEIRCPASSSPSLIAATLNSWAGVIEYAYESQPTEPAAVVAINNPRFSQQTYLSPSPVGIGAMSAWALGADGSGFGFVDIEHGWFLDHEDLPINLDVTLGVNRTKDHGHGTAVIGVVAAADNTTGVVGLAPEILIYLLSIEDRVPSLTRSADHAALRISQAAVLLNPGDVLLLEVQALGGPVELSRPVFEAIRLATAKGIVVVEPTGNGGLNLDFATNEQGKRSLDRTHPDFEDSGAIMVSAARAAWPHERLRGGFGNRVDCYAWGEQVHTTGSRNTPVKRNDYFEFSGTSSASSIIAGVCLLMQDLRVRRGPPGTPRFRPKELRAILSDENNGEPSFLATEPIGVMPDFAKIIARGLV
jgi:hypothetical protein